MALTERIQRKIATTFERINTAGKNPGGREAVLLETWSKTQAGDNALKSSASVKLEDPAPVSLVPLTMEFKSVSRFDASGAMIASGDVVVELARYSGDTEITREMLLGTDLANGREVRYRIGSLMFHLPAGQLSDIDGFTWRMLLKEIKS